MLEGESEKSLRVHPKIEKKNSATLLGLSMTINIIFQNLHRKGLA
jgi:hypothetical protein